MQPFTVDPSIVPEVSGDLELRPIVLSEYDADNTIFQFETMIGGNGEGNIDHSQQIRLRHVATGMFVHFHGDVTNVCNQVSSETLFFSFYLVTVQLLFHSFLGSFVHVYNANTSFGVDWLIKYPIWQKYEEDVLNFIEAKPHEVHSMNLIRGVTPSLILYANKACLSSFYQNSS
jgi:hypothetical protein